MNPYLEAQLAPFVEQYQEKLAQAGSDQTDWPKPEKRVLSPAEKQIADSAAHAIKTWEQSPEGQAQLAAMQNMSLADLTAALKELLEGPVFAPTIALTVTLPDLPFTCNAVSIAINFEAEIFIGFAGSLGYAVSPQDLKGPSTSFLSLQVDLGVEGGALAGLQFGFWEQTPPNLGGFSANVEVEVLDGGGGVVGTSVGFTVKPLKVLWDAQGATITIAAGIEDGAGFSVSYTIILTTLDLSLPPIYQPRAKHMLILNHLNCLNAKNNVDHVSFTFTPDGGANYPYPTWDSRSMADGSNTTQTNWNTGRSVWFDNSVTIQLTINGDTNKNLNCVFDYSDFSGSTPVTKTMDTKEGLDEIKYQMTATLVF